MPNFLLGWPKFLAEDSLLMIVFFDPQLPLMISINVSLFFAFSM
jgi:hypothetical protein